MPLPFRSKMPHSFLRMRSLPSSSPMGILREKVAQSKLVFASWSVIFTPSAWALRPRFMLLASDVLKPLIECRSVPLPIVAAAVLARALRGPRTAWRAGHQASKSARVLSARGS